MLKKLFDGIRGKGEPSAPLMRDGKPDGDALAAHKAPSAAQVNAGLAGEDAIAWVLLAGIHRVGGCEPALLAALAQDGFLGTAAAWTLGRLKAESALCALIPTGGIDVRQNGYHALSVLAAERGASPALPAFLREQVSAEIQRAKAGKTGLGEHACRPLAVLGDETFAATAQGVIENDRFCDRFEVQRQRKAVEDNGKDNETIRELTRPWQELFADQLAPAVVEPEAEPAAKAAPEAEVVPETPPQDEAKPVDWKAFADSPEATALPPQVKQLAGQLGPMLEQLAQRGLNAPLTDLTAQELAALLLQVLPQALPPQHVQAALSPQAINAYQAMAKYLVRTKTATQGDGLIQGVAMVRQALIEQMRRGGMLGGPDYSDPDVKKP